MSSVWLGHQHRTKRLVLFISRVLILAVVAADAILVPLSMSFKPSIKSLDLLFLVKEPKSRSQISGSGSGNRHWIFSVLVRLKIIYNLDADEIILSQNVGNLVDRILRWLLGCMNEGPNVFPFAPKI